MTLESALYSHLSGFAGLTALVSTRIYPVRAPQDVALPYVVYFRVSGVREQAVTRAVGATAVRMQFSAFSPFAGGFTAAAAIRDQCRAAALAYVTGGGVTVHDMMLGSDQDDFEDDTQLFHCLCEAEFVVGGDL